MADNMLNIQRLNKYYQTNDALHLKDYEKTKAYDQYNQKIKGLWVFPLGF